MTVAVLVDAAPLRGLVFATAMSLPSILFVLVVYRRFRDPAYLGVLAILVVASMQSLSHLSLVIWGGLLDYVDAGMQLHRITSLLSAAQIAALPYFLATALHQSPRLYRVNMNLARAGIVIVALLVAVAFAAPDLFVSVTVPDTTIAVRGTADGGRGTLGPVYAMRNALLLLSALYAAAFSIVAMVRSSDRAYSVIIAAGTLVAALFALDDLYRLITGSYSGLFTQESFSRYGIGVAILALSAVAATTWAFARDVRDVHAMRGALARRRSAAEREAFRDPLTGLGNEIMLEEHLRAGLGSNGVMLLDIGGFGRINATRGSHVGDAVVVQLAARLRAAIGEGEHLYRRAGSRFVIAWDRDADVPDRHTRASELISKTGNPVRIGRALIGLTLRAGVTARVGDGRRPGLILAASEAALNHARSTGAPIAVYDETIEQSLTRFRDVVTALREAVPDRELSLVYQPIVDRTGTIVALEALLRWDSPRLGRVGPGEFIPVAERLNLIASITRASCHMLFDDCRLLAERLGVNAPLTHLNLSVPLLQDTEFCAELAADIIESGVEPGRIAIEVTESALLTNPMAALASLGGLRRAGCPIALDDFGTGYASFSYVRDMPLDEIKIDRALVSAAGRGGSARELVTALVRLGHDLGCTLIGEGVETETEIEALLEAGCDMMQGYRYYRPMSLAALLPLIGAGVERG